MADQFIGEVRIFGFNFAPQGWALCDGQILPISQNTALFSLLGTNFGGNGTSNFALPNLQGRVAMHPDGNSVVGETGGAETVTLSANEIPRHGHEVMGKLGRRDTTSPAGASLVPGDMYGSGTADATMAAGAVQSGGGGQPHSNMQPYLAINFCIALEGIFPPRS